MFRHIYCRTTLEIMSELNSKNFKSKSSKIVGKIQLKLSRLSVKSAKNSTEVSYSELQLCFTLQVILQVIFRIQLRIFWDKAWLHFGWSEQDQIS